MPSGEFEKRQYLCKKNFCSASSMFKGQISVLIIVSQFILRYFCKEKQPRTFRTSKQFLTLCGPIFFTKNFPTGPNFFLYQINSSPCSMVHSYQCDSLLHTTQKSARISPNVSSKKLVTRIKLLASLG